MARSGHFAIGDPIITAATLLLFVGACGKSAQLPLYVWLPDAMEGPTPVSALIHAATMVTAGVYMVARSNALFVLAPDSMKTVAIVGALTAIFAASIGLVQNDIKRVLAYSTVSQLGYMFLALGVGAFAAGVFHVFTHAFFKALLFLGAGSVIHAMSGEQDMRNMGDLHRRSRSLTGPCSSPPWRSPASRRFAGFFSKDEILWQAWTSEGGAYRLLWLVGYGTALMTAFYMFRLMFLTFYGQPRMSHEVEHHIHESPKSMTVPLIVLGILRDHCRMAGLAAQPGRIEPLREIPGAGLCPGSARASGRREAAQLAAGEKEEEHTSPLEYRPDGASRWRPPLSASGMAWTSLSRRRQRLRRAHCRSSAAALHRPATTSITWTKSTTTLFTGRRKVGDVRLGVMGLGEASSWFDVARHRRHGQRRGLDRRALSGTISKLVGHVDHRRRRGERPSHPGADVVVSGAPAASGAWCSGTRW